MWDKELCSCITLSSVCVLCMQAPPAHRIPEFEKTEGTLRALVHALELPLEQRPTPVQAWCMLASAMFIEDQFELVDDCSRREWLGYMRGRAVFKRAHVVCTAVVR